jgi:hypothetical protein
VENLLRKRRGGELCAMKKALKIILGSLVLSIALCVIAIGPVALIFPVYVPFCLYVYVVHPLFSYPLILGGSLLACVPGGLMLSRWPVGQLRYAVVPATAMGLTTAWLPPQVCGFDPMIFNTFVESILFVGAAGLAASTKEYTTRVCAVLALLCGIAVALQVHVGLCHDDHSPDGGLIAVSGRNNVWLAILAAMALGWLSAWFGTQIHRLMPSMRG